MKYWRISNMATGLCRRSGVFSAMFVRLLSERQPAISCLISWTEHLRPCRKLHTSELTYGGRPKSVWRRKRVPALTRLCTDLPEKFKTRRAFGGGEKTKVTRVQNGLYTWKSQDVELQTPILDVLYNSAHKHFTERKIMVRGTIIEVSSEPFQKWYEEVRSSTQSQPTVDIDERILSQIQNGKVLAKVSSRPGQEGTVNGYLLEGEELDKYLEQTKPFNGNL